MNNLMRKSRGRSFTLLQMITFFLLIRVFMMKLANCWCSWMTVSLSGIYANKERFHWCHLSDREFCERTQRTSTETFVS